MRKSMSEIAAELDDVIEKGGPGSGRRGHRTTPKTVDTFEMSTKELNQNLKEQGVSVEKVDDGYKIGDWHATQVTIYRQYRRFGHQKASTHSKVWTYGKKDIKGLKDAHGRYADSFKDIKAIYLDKILSVKKSLSFNPLSIPEMTLDSNYYNPYRTLSDGTFMPHPREYWTSQGRNPEGYQNVFEMYRDAGAYRKSLSELSKNVENLIKGGPGSGRRGHRTEAHYWAEKKKQRLAKEKSLKKNIESVMEGETDKFSIRRAPGGFRVTVRGHGNSNMAASVFKERAESKGFKNLRAYPNERRADSRPTTSSFTVMVDDDDGVKKSLSEAEG